MTTSDKITHLMDVLFFIGLVVLVFVFVRADNEHEKQIASLEQSLQKVQGQLTIIEGKLANSGDPPARPPGQSGAATTPPSNQ